MAELKNYVMSVVALLFIATASVTIYSTALVNNIANGGNSTGTQFLLLDQTQNFTNQMSNFSDDLAKSTYAASSTQDWTTALVAGIGAITQAGAGANALTFSSINILIGMTSAIGPVAANVGVPGWVMGFGILSITIGIVFAILAALYKWWL